MIGEVCVAKEMPKGSIRLFDIAAVALLLVIAVLPLVLTRPSDVSMTAEVVVSADGEVSRYPLFEDTEIEVSSRGFSYVISVSNGAVSVVSADCPDHICAETGEIRSTSGSIVCIPGHLIVTVSDEGGDGDGSDIIAGR